MNGGEISNNAASGISNSGGGVHAASNSTFTMTGGEISYNTVRNNGGGVLVNVSSTFTMTGGKISNNTATNNGDGVYANSGAFITFGGTAEIVNNTISDGIVHNVYLISGQYITISTTTSPALGMKIGVTKVGDGDVFVESSADLADTLYFISDDPAKKVRYSGGQLVLSSSEFHGGGTEANPYLISTAAELAKLAELVNAGNTDYNNNKYYKLLENIDLGVAPYNEGEGWVPIGSSSNGFYGSFDGNGKTISNLFINRPGTNVQGLFGGIGVGMVKNLGVVNMDITGGSTVGGIASFVNNGTVQNCYTTGTVTGTNKIGGLVGELDVASVTNSYSTATVNGNSEVGGLVGNAGFLSISITNCAALNAEVNGNSNVSRIMYDDYGNATLSNNFAYSGLPGTDGTDITATDIITDGTIGGLFTAPVWTTENGKLPGFGAAVAMPAHLKP